MIFQNHSLLSVGVFRVKINATLKSVTGKIFRIGSKFKGTVSGDRFRKCWQKL